MSQEGILGITSFPSVANQYVTDSGSATPAANILNVLGGTDITTSGAGNTVTIAFSGGGVISTITGNSGGAVPPTAGNINVVGTGAVTVSGNQGTSTLTISIPGGAYAWNVIGASQDLVAGNGYFCTSGGALSLGLPITSVLGDSIRVALNGSTSWTITQPNAATIIRIGTSQTTLGVGGSITSTAQGDSIEIVCMRANAVWQVVDFIGNITVV